MSACSSISVSPLLSMTSQRPLNSASHRDVCYGFPRPHRSVAGAQYGRHREVSVAAAARTGRPQESGSSDRGCSHMRLQHAPFAKSVTRGAAASHELRALVRTTLAWSPDSIRSGSYAKYEIAQGCRIRSIGAAAGRRWAASGGAGRIRRTLSARKNGGESLSLSMRLRTATRRHAQ